jgi:hypothetical protein
VNFYAVPAHTCARGQAVPSGCRAGRRTTTCPLLQDIDARMGFKPLEGRGRGKVRDGRGVGLKDI